MHHPGAQGTNTTSARLLSPLLWLSSSEPAAMMLSGQDAQSQGWSAGMPIHSLVFGRKKTLAFSQFARDSHTSTSPQTLSKFPLLNKK